jgi:ribosomal protein L12E/L44/L45/RPP1/RPP2
MPHELFGPLTYSKKAAAWGGHHALPRFAAVAVRSVEKPPLDDDALKKLMGETQQALDRKMDELRQKLGPGMDKLFPALQEAMKAPPPKPAPEAPAARRRREAEEERERAATEAAERRRRQGLFPFTVVDPTGAGPTPQQEAAFRHLTDNEAEVSQAVLEALYRSHQQYYEDERWRRICDLPEIQSPAGVTAAAHLLGVRVCRESADGVAHLLFEVDCDWEQEHGMCVVYRKDTGADWATFDGVDELLGVEYDEGNFELPGN